MHDLRPDAILPVNPAAIPPDLRRVNAWVNWTEGKVPINSTTLKRASPTDERTWGTFARAMRRYQAGEALGVGFVLHEYHYFVVIDLDGGCRDPETGRIESWADAIISEFNSYTEVSPSGTGVHIWVRGVLPPGGNNRKPIEMYSRWHYMTVTGCHLTDTPLSLESRQAQIEALHARVFPKRTAGTVNTTPSTPVCILSDDELLEKAFGARNGEKIARLWEGDISDHRSHSEADSALICALAFYSDNHDQLDRLFRRSRLMRAKWDTTHGQDTYGNLTIAHACATVTRRYHRPSVTLRTIDATDAPTLPAVEGKAVYAWR